MEKNTITLGMYPQNLDSQKEAVEWIVLKKENSCCLCTSKYLLNCKPLSKTHPVN